MGTRCVPSRLPPCLLLVLLASASTLVVSEIPSRQPASFSESTDPASEYIPSGLRVRRSPVLPNKQGSEYGISIQLVNSSRGNLTFKWHDLVLPGHIPFTVGRTYSSDSVPPPADRRGSAIFSDAPWGERDARVRAACAADFGPGWRLSPVERILLRPGGARLELHADNGRSYRFVRSLEGAFVPEHDRPEVKWEEILPLTHDVLEARIAGGMVHTYERGQSPGLYLLAEKRDANGHWVRLSWKGDLLTRIENDGGAYVEVDRRGSRTGVAEPDSSHHRISALRDSAGRAVRFRYDIRGSLVESIAPGNSLTRWEYDSEGRLIGVHDSLARRLLATEYDAGSRVSAFQMGGGRLSFEHDRVTHGTSVLNATGDRTLIHHDPEGRAVRVIDPMGFENSFVYGESGDLVEHRDSQGRSTRYKYARHLVTQVEHEDGSSMQFERDADGRLTAFTDPRGAVTRYSYDGRGNLLGVTDALEYTRTGTYDGAGNLIGYTDALRRMTHFAHDAFGRPTLVVERDGSRWEIEYDPGGPISRIIRPDGESVLVRFDSAGRRIGVVTPEGLTQEAAYDAGGLLSSYVDRSGRRFDLKYNQARRLASAATAGGNSASYAYDANGHLSWIRRAEGPSTEYGYDARNQLSWVRNWPGEDVGFRYDGEGRLVERSLEVGATVAYSYDQAGRLRSSVLPDETAEQLEHDAAGNLVRLTSPSSDLAMEYDDLNRLVQVSRLDLGRSLSLTYDAIGNRSEIRSDDGAYISYAYDALNRLVRAEDSVLGLYELGYDEASRQRSRLRTGDGVQTSYAYDRAGRLVSYEVRSADGRIIEGESYSRDERGRSPTEDWPPTSSRRSWVERRRGPSDHAGRILLFAEDGRIAEIDQRTGSITLINDLDAVGLQVANVTGTSLAQHLRPTWPGSGVVMAPTDGILRLLGGSSAPTQSIPGPGVQALTEFEDMRSFLEALGHYAWLPPFSGLEKLMIQRGFIDLGDGPDGFEVEQVAGQGRGEPPDGSGGLLRRNSLDGARWEFSTTRYYFNTTLIGIVGGAVSEPEGLPSIESHIPIGPEDPPTWQEGCSSDPYGYCDASLAAWDPCCHSPGGGPSGGGGDGGGGGGGGEGSCTLSISPSSVDINPGQSASFTANAVDCSDIPSWSTDGGSPPFGTGTSFTALFPVAGNFTVTATADGVSASASVIVVPPSCNFTVSASPSSPYIGDPVTLTANGNCVQYSWSTQSTACPGTGGVNPWTTKFIQAGSRIVTVAGGNPSGTLTTIKPFNLTVQACTTSLSGPSSAIVGQSVCYSSSVTGGASGTYTWTAPGGVPGSQSGPASSFCTVFPAVGTFTVTLGFNKTVPGCSPVACVGSSRQVTVSPIPPPTVQINSTNPTTLGTAGSRIVSATGRDGFGNPTSGSYAWSTSNSAVLSISGSGSSIQLTGGTPGTATLSVQFVTSAGSATDQVTVNVVGAGLTVFRPTTEGPAYGAPFARRPIPDAEEYSPGAGIRINGDADSAAQENDLIEIEVQVSPFPTPPGVEYVLRRSTDSLQVWDSPSMGTPILTSGSEAPVAPTGPSTSVWVESVGAVPADIAFVARDIPAGTDVASDSAHIYPFRGIVIALGGETQDPTDPADSNHGIFQLAIELYSQGYDVHMLNEDVVTNDGSGAAYDEVVSAIQNRGAMDVAIFGYSHGGGSTHDLAERLDLNRGVIGTFDLAFTAYIDAVENDTATDLDQETRRPPASLFHVNFFQEGLLGGAPTVPPADYEVNVDEFVETHTHGTIDDDPLVLGAIRVRLMTRTSK